MLKVLHTSDWHLGQRLLSKDRKEEHEEALNWLLEVIEQESVDLLLVAGDIFDIGNPPNYARAMYYRFITQLRNIGCRHVIITGGNHDSPGMLEAPKELLEVLDIHVIGAATENIADEIIELKNEQGALEAVVAAIPFLRDRDLRKSVAGESGAERLEQIRMGIQNHFQEAAKLMEGFEKENIPLIAMGHLHATGAEATESQQPIYIGDIENISANAFPALFHYIALGHIHRPQAIGGKHHIRYSGSLIPLDFSETKDDKSVYLLQFEGNKLNELKTVALPVFRRLKHISGELDEVKASLERFAAKNDRSLRPWVEVTVETDRILPQLDQQIRDFCQEMPFDILSIKLKRNYQSLQVKEAEAPDLENLTVEEVFKEKCKSYGSPPDEMDELMNSFQELRNWWSEQEKEA